MPRWLLILAGGGAGFVLAFAASAMGAYNAALVLLFLGFVAVVVAILYRPREVRTAEDARVFDGAGVGWGTGIGPVPGEMGTMTPAEQLPYALTRVYRARSRNQLERLRLTDGGLLAGRGYVPTSSQYLDGQWRGVDWAVGVLMLLIALIVGVVALVYMAFNKPTGTLTVTYERRGPVSIGSAQAPPSDSPPFAPAT